MVLWASGFVVARLTAGHVEPLSFLAIRFPLAAALMLALVLAFKGQWPDRQGATHAIIAGAFLHSLYLAPIYWAVTHGMPGGVSALIVGLQPLLTVFFAVPMLKEKIDSRHWLGLITGIIGVALVLAPKFSWATLGGITPLTAGAVIFGAIAATFGTVYQKRYAAKLPLLTSVFWQYVGASLIVVTLASLTENFVFDATPQAWGGLAWALLISIAAILMLMLLIREGAVAKVSTLIFLVPGVTALMTFALFGETLTLIQIAGMLITAAAVLIVNRRKV